VFQDGSVRQVSDIGFVPDQSRLEPGDHPLRVVPFIAQLGADSFLSDVNWTLAGN
jgi:hypothetical protein